MREVSDPSQVRNGIRKMSAFSEDGINAQELQALLVYPDDFRERVLAETAISGAER